MMMMTIVQWRIGLSHAHLVHGGEDEADALLVHGEHLRRVVVRVELTDVHAELAQKLRLRAHHRQFVRSFRKLVVSWDFL